MITTGRGNDEDIQVRLEKLERANERLEKASRHFTLLSVAFGAMLALILVLAATKAPAPPDKSGRTSGQAPVSDLIRAKRLQLVDKDGKTRIDIVGPAPFGPAFYLLDERGYPQIALNTNLEGEPQLKVYDKKAKTRALLWMTSRGPDLTMLDENDVIRLYLGVAQSVPYFIMYDKKGNTFTWPPPEKE